MDSEDLGRFEFRPLYRQVRDKLIRQLADGVWAPGDILPSEVHLAAELGVSQGTIRKALDVLASEKMVVRRQGRGTFVASHDEEHGMFQFFKVVPDAGPRTIPRCVVNSITRHRATPEERDLLHLTDASYVMRIARVRWMLHRPVIYETISVPALLFPGLADMNLPDNIYGFYAAKFSVSVARSQERLKAVAAGAREAGELNVAVGHPLLAMRRLAYSVDNVPVETRLSFCLTDGVHYLAEH
ncbi:GntR family transcriptional regulator [Aureimonas fodinaquatilis]|uniref:GntR family transcriptional regulator n=1 Tax=Aureimonas fodinaquatilis TaxID=2565783 RepID=A0A5B0DRC2_9HYPH|nr:GntR family transcriptional regulator [Aureimonas fodinaquatilis]KAA0968923.1 GntR family transcriptional regulator [Aureimonas fodinaquatilis]